MRRGGQGPVEFEARELFAPAALRLCPGGGRVPGAEIHSVGGQSLLARRLAQDLCELV